MNKLFKIVVSKCHHEYYNEHDGLVTEIERVKITDANDKLVNTGNGFESAHARRVFVAGLMMGIRLHEDTYQLVYECDGEPCQFSHEDDGCWHEDNDDDDDDDEPTTVRCGHHTEREDFHADG